GANRLACGKRARQRHTSGFVCCYNGCLNAGGVRKLDIRLHRRLRADSTHTEVRPRLHQLDDEIGINYEPTVRVRGDSASISPRLDLRTNRVTAHALARIPAGA